MGKQSESKQSELIMVSRKKYAAMILLFGILSVPASVFPVLGLVFGIIAISMYVKNNSVKTIMMADVGKTLGLIGLILNLIITEIELLFFPLEKIP